MIYSRQQHWQFLEEELKAQTNVFKQKLDAPAFFLLQDREELFVAQYVKFLNGVMILKFSNKRSLPRPGEHLYCFTVAKELRDYKKWGKRTYGDLIKAKTNYSEIVCIWQAPLKEEDFSIAGFRCVELEFFNYIKDAEGMIVLLGPNKPPFEYLTNLQKIVLNVNNKLVSDILDQDFHNSNWEPSLIDNKKDIVDYILNQLALQDSLIIQGPPGTGKTHLIAEICEKLCNENKTVLVSALTNRALIELVEKPALKKLLEEHKIFKTKLSVDESMVFKDLRQADTIVPQPGHLILSTLYYAIAKSTQIEGNQPFDYAIVDEAGQALLGVFAGAKLLGKKNIWIGDTMQLPPVVAISNDVVKKNSYALLVDGLKTLVDHGAIPVFQLTETYRLTQRAAQYTGIFYKNSLKTRSRNEINFAFNKLFNPKGGPTLVKTDLKNGDFKPPNALRLSTEIVKQILSIDKNIHISVLSYFVETTKALQKTIFSAVGHQSNLLIETISRVQGLTTDVTIFVIPNASYHRSLEKRVFNVATSRSKRHTIIISDKNILAYRWMDEDVKTFLHELNEDYSFYILLNPDLKLLNPT